MSKRKDRIQAKDIEQMIILVITALGLIGLLSYTFWHTGGWFSRYINPYQLGYGAAFGAELIIVMMSYKLAKLKEIDKSNGFLYFALIAALVISAWANYYEGFATYHRTEPNIETWWTNLDPILFVSSLLATALISILVFAVTDILSSDVTIVSGKVEKVLQAYDINEKMEMSLSENDTKMTVPKLSPAAKKKQALQLLSDGISISEVAEQLNIAETTVYRYRRNGN